MEVQAQNQPNGFIDLRSRALQLSAMDPKHLQQTSIPFFVDASRPAMPAAQPQPYIQQTLFQPALVPSFTAFQSPATDAINGGTGCSAKRRKQMTQQQLNIPQLDLRQARLNSCAANPAPMVVSTGLRLAFDDEHSSVSSELGSKPLSVLHDELSAQLSQQKEELDQLVSSQIEQLKQVFEKQQTQSKIIFSAIEENTSRQLQERELEIDRLNRRNMELEERMRSLTAECHMWQSKAKSNEAMAVVLRANLQQAMVLSREQMSKEGCGDSEADDAASAIHVVDDSHSGRLGSIGLEQVRTCKRCRAREVSVLLLPCLHLCLCVGCKAEVSRCPVCQSLSSASVEVYLS